MRSPGFQAATLLVMPTQVGMTVVRCAGHGFLGSQRTFRAHHARKQARASGRRHDHDLGAVAVGDQAGGVDAGGNIAQHTVISSSPGGKDGDAVHVVLGRMGACRLHGGGAGGVAGGAGPIVDLAFQVEQIVDPPRGGVVAHGGLPT